MQRAEGRVREGRHAFRTQFVPEQTGHGPVNLFGIKRFVPCHRRCPAGFAEQRLMARRFPPAKSFGDRVRDQGQTGGKMRGDMRWRFAVNDAGSCSPSV